MNALLAYARDLLMLRRGPQDLPYSPAMTAALFVAAVVADLMLDILVLHETSAIARVAVADGLMLVLPYLALAVAGREARYPQTLAAICILSIVFAAALAPVLMVQPAADTKAAATALQTLSAFIGLGVGVLVALAFFAVSVTIGSYLFPQAAQ